MGVRRGAYSYKSMYTKLFTATRCINVHSCHVVSSVEGHEFLESPFAEHRAMGLSGLTLPCLIGSQEYLRGFNAFIELFAFMKQLISDKRTKYHLRIYADIGEVIGEIQKPLNPYYKYPFLNRKSQVSVSVGLGVNGI